MTEEKVLLKAVLVFPVRAKGEVLLALKAAKIGAGCWNGYGGGIESGESARSAASRELFEESGLKALPGDLQKVAVVDFLNTKSDGKVFRCRVHVFLAPAFSGTPKETKEMLRPSWHKMSEILWGSFMPADRFWLPPVFEGKKIIASALYGPKQEKLLGPVQVKEATDAELMKLEEP